MSKLVESEAICWFRGNLPSETLNLLRVAGVAADVVLVQHLWLFNPAIAPYAYEFTVYKTNKEVGVAVALSTICGNKLEAPLDAAVNTQAGALIGDCFLHPDV